MLDNTSPLISIIIPVYNVEAYINKCIDSLLKQRYSNIEVLLVDDGSTDNSGKICDDYAKQDKRICVVHKENGGVSSARNTGLKLVKGDYIAWVDPDDWIEEDMFSYLIENAITYSADITICARIERYPDKSVIKGLSELSILNTEEALSKLFEDKDLGSYLWDKLWRKELFEDIVFPEGKVFEDIAVVYKVFGRANRILCLPEAKYNYLQRTDSIVGSQKLKSRIARFDAEYERLNNVIKSLPQYSDILISKCIEAAVNVWISYYSVPKEQREAYTEKLKEISLFSSRNYKRVLNNNELGITGKLSILFLPYTQKWSFAAVKVLNFIYKIRHH